MKTLADTATNTTEAQIPGGRPGDTVEILHNIPGFGWLAQDAVSAVIRASQAVLATAAATVRTPLGDVSFGAPGAYTFEHADAGWVLGVEALEDPDSGERFYRVLDHSVDPIEYAEEFGA